MFIAQNNVGGSAADVATGFVAAISVVPSVVAVAWFMARAGDDFSVGCATGLIGAGLVTGVLSLLRVPLVAVPSPSIALWLVMTEAVSLGASLESLRAISVTAYFAALPLVLLPLGKRIHLPESLSRSLAAALAFMLIVAGLMYGRVLVPSAVTVTMFGSLADPFCFTTLLGTVLTLGLAACGIKSALFFGAAATFIYVYNGGFVVLPDVCFASNENVWSEFMRLDFVAACDLPHVFLVLTVVILLGNIAVINGYLPANNAMERKNFEHDKILATLLGGGILAAIIGALPITAAPESAVLANVRSPRLAGATAAACLAFMGLFAVPLIETVTDFTAVFAPILIACAVLWLCRQHNVLEGDLADKAAGVTLLVAFPLAQDMALGFGAAVVIYVLLRFLGDKRPQGLTEGVKKR